ncbi:MAG: hypothetical protein PHD95_06160 [Candidatus ainarchaeum sp.]|nr:hypothetical protein [Candidatus ainarchaeum sp.]
MNGMKLQKQSTRKVGTKEYVKWVTTISPKLIQDLDWKEGDQLEPSTRGKKLIIQKKGEKK